MNYQQFKRLELREKLKRWTITSFVFISCFGGLVLLSGCKEPKTAALAPTTVTEVNRDQVDQYLNNSNKELHTPEIMHTTEPTDTLKNTPPVTPQINGSF